MNDVANWWSTAIIDMEPGRINIRGRPIEGLIGSLNLPPEVQGTVHDRDMHGAALASLVAEIDIP